ncbi:PKIP [Euproctis pseudoconspersa nucleopolyhedrovirus]|uniref:PKIP n=1 Tax=Euproctis pseudoconspersa nucleopolyhedrovirus TaxID=307467 RepID=C3TX27_9ABAC|nr:PKIP [Euproctis pseudoconspersa nucleopolyhedrovirus]ACO53569.1 PKIP [Euproctis pseudoconspersa nucleopolyhedrovirus]QUJ09309.1 PKIP protein [Gynaephora ruoergensis nucleopolyhedrovirus]
MDHQISVLKQKRSKYTDEYQAKAEAFFRKGGKRNCQNLVNELYAMSAVLFGLNEQIFSVTNNFSRDERIEFINNLNEFGLDNEFVEKLCATRDNKLLLTHYKVADVDFDDSSRSIHNMLLSNCKKFTNVLCQFVDKRNAYRKKANDSLLAELVVLKSILVKHLCVIQKLANYKPFL